MSLITIIKIIYLSYNKDEFKRLLFAAIGILLGGALFTSVRISTENIELSLASSENYLSRNVIHIRSNTGFIPESLVKQIAFVPGVKSVTPVNEKFIKGYIGKQSIGAVQIIGIDIIKILDFAGTKENKKSISSLSNYLKYYSKDPIYVLASQKLYNQAHDVPLDLEINGKLVKVQIGGVIPSSIESKVENYY
jgi:hypothetical protein